MKLRESSILIVGLTALLLLTTTVSAEEVSDGTGDVYHWAINPNTGALDYIESTGDKPYIDITKLSYTKNGQQVTLEMTLNEDIVDSASVLYYIYLETDGGYYMAFYSIGVGMYTGYEGYTGEGEILVDPVSGSTFTATFNITDPDVIYTFWGQTIEIAEVGSDEAWHDFAGYYTGTDPASDGDDDTTDDTTDDDTGDDDAGDGDTGDDDTDDGDTGDGDTGDGDTGDGDTGDGDTGDGDDGTSTTDGTPGFEALAVIVALAIALIILRRKK